MVKCSDKLVSIFTIRLRSDKPVRKPKIRPYYTWVDVNRLNIERKELTRLFNRFAIADFLFDFAHAFYFAILFGSYFKEEESMPNTLIDWAGTVAAFVLPILMVMNVLLLWKLAKKTKKLIIPKCIMLMVRLLIIVPLLLAVFHKSTITFSASIVYNAVYLLYSCGYLMRYSRKLLVKNAELRLAQKWQLKEHRIEL